MAAQTFIQFSADAEAPDSNDDSASGSEDTALVIDVLANDTNGDNPIDPTTVQIDGTANPGDSLVVADLPVSISDLRDRSLALSFSTSSRRLSISKSSRRCLLESVSVN